jgi:hypothetical protein
MTAEEKLKMLENAIRAFANASSYKDGCKCWGRSEKLVGIKK